MSRWFRNGDVIDAVAIDDRGFQYGDGLFETIAIRDGEPRLWNYHLDRAERGCKRLNLVMPRRGDLRQWLDHALRESGEDTSNCTLKMILSSGTSERGYWRKTPSEVVTMFGVFAARAIPTAHYRDGVDTILCRTRLALYSATAGCKTLNRLEQVLARSELESDDTFEGITLDASGRVICGTMSNVFIVRDDSIMTPSLERCGVEGVMRRRLIDLLSNESPPIEVRDISEDEFFDSDEVFLCNSQFGVLPVRRCHERLWRTHTMTRHIMAKLSAHGVPECSA